MSEYTPTTEEVRELIVAGHENQYRDELGNITGASYGEGFDRWLAEVKAQAWEEGCRWGAVEFQTLEAKLEDEDKVQVTDADNPYKKVKNV